MSGPSRVSGGVALPPISGTILSTRSIFKGDPFHQHEPEPYGAEQHPISRELRIRQLSRTDVRDQKSAARLRSSRSSRQLPATRQTSSILAATLLASHGRRARVRSLGQARPTTDRSDILSRSLPPTAIHAHRTQIALIRAKPQGRKVQHGDSLAEGVRCRAELGKRLSESPTTPAKSPKCQLCWYRGCPEIGSGQACRRLAETGSLPIAATSPPNAARAGERPELPVALSPQWRHFTQQLARHAIHDVAVRSSAYNI
jgi:hypothetical protein